MIKVGVGSEFLFCFLRSEGLIVFVEFVFMVFYFGMWYDV